MSKRVLSETSKNIYSKNIIRLNDGEPIKNYNFLKKTDVIISKIEHLKPNSQRTYLISIVSTLKGLKGFEKEFKIYYNKMMELNNELKVNNTKSETQEANWISQEEVLKIYHNLADKVLPLLKLKVNKKINEKEWDDILDFVVLSLYVLQQPRRLKDYQLMKVIKSTKDLTEDYKDFNYYLPTNNKFLFYNFKTSHTYQLQEIDVSDELQNILLQYLKIHPLRKDKNFFLLVNIKGEELKQVNSITRILNKIFNKKISVSMLRNIYLTDKFKTPMEELKETATNMGTSSSTISNNYIKMDNK
jgi:hypothetical protein